MRKDYSHLEGSKGRQLELERWWTRLETLEETMKVGVAWADVKEQNRNIERAKPTAN